MRVRIPGWLLRVFHAIGLTDLTDVEVEQYVAIVSGKIPKPTTVKVVRPCSVTIHVTRTIIASVASDNTTNATKAITKSIPKFTLGSMSVRAEIGHLSRV